ncbi:MAG: 4-hydroxybenzoyl-CoA reductase [Anaerolineae bacterium]|nr:FAD binding domain-containing protein [Anaerolineae bacterium]MCQ3975591.1 4-hydroxybenzoyl-CoA reductase [Anaerolineae bacterium]
MLRLPPFEYLAPHSVEEAVELMSQYGPETTLVAGGTDLFPNMKRRLLTPKKLIGLGAIADLKKFEANGAVTLGAGLTLTQITRHPAIVGRYPALATAAGLVSTPQLRNLGTIGGNLCLDTRCTYYNQTEPWREALGYCMKKDGHICWVAPGSPRCWAVSSSDTAPVMIALEASVRLVGPNGERTMPVQALYHNDGIAYLTKAPDEILADIHLPDASGMKMAYKKLRRRGSFDFPILGVAVVLRQAEDGTVTAANIVLGAVASYPIKAVEAEEILVGQKLTDEVVEAAAKAAFKPAKPLDNTDMGHPYRKQMVQVYVAQALREAVGMANQRMVNE